MLNDKKYDVEHALGMHCTNSVLMPASAIYNKETLEQFAESLATFHIYMIGLVPQIELVASEPQGDLVITTYEVAGIPHKLLWRIPPGCTLKCEDELWFPVDNEGVPSFASEEKVCRRLSDEQNAVGFEVLYIGQAYGKKGSRNAVERLLKHETLQKISLQGIPKGYHLYLLLLEIEADNKIFTVFNPHAQNRSQGPERISMGLDKLFNTDEAERITLYEASLIRYFQPKYNKEFKSSFPSTNLKVLADCYDKDFASVIAEIAIEELPLKIFSKAVAPAWYHLIKHDLHDEAERNAFFLFG
jgi:hypothetical protein